MSGTLVAAVAAVALVLTCGAAAPAQAEFGLVPGSVEVRVLDGNGAVENRAGAHPDRLMTTFAFQTDANGDVEANPRDILVDLPAGMIGDARATPRCPRAVFTSGACPPETQVGISRPVFSGLGAQELPIYNIEPANGNLAELGFTVLVLPARFMISLRPDDYGIRMASENLGQEFPMLSSEMELWGVPADHQVGTAIPRRPFLTNPTNCGAAPEPTVLRMRSWQRPDEWMTVTTPNAPLVGCENLPFVPTLDIAPSHDAADSPTGMRIDVHVPQNADAAGLASAHVAHAEITLPAGFSLSPTVGDGLTACDDADLRLRTSDPAACPDSSKVGAVELVSPAFGDALGGDLYIGRSLPGDRYRLFMTVHGPGFVVKLRGSLHADPTTGRLTTVLGGLPAVPFSRLSMTLKDGPRAPIASPPACTSGTASALLTTHHGSSAAPAATVVTGHGPGGTPCLSTAPFAPVLTAGSSPAVAGAASRFSTTIQRGDGEQSLGGVAVTMPPGVTARVGTAERCPDAQASAGECPAASRIGSVTGEAGAGPAPLRLTGDAYLTGRYRGAPFGMALVLPARVGPFDLGKTIIRATMRTDPFDGQLRVVTDPLPQILEGMPLRLRGLTLDIDRPGFIVNPTSCARRHVDVAVTSVSGFRYRALTRFGLRGCRHLAFEPRLSVRLTGRKPRRPGMTVAMRIPSGGANLRSVSILLPSVVQPATFPKRRICMRARAHAGTCPPTSRVGRARAQTPLLSRPLTGPVHLVDSQGFGAPELWTTLAGEGLRLTTRSVLSLARSGRLRSEFVALPDLPLSHFTTRIAGGRRALLLAGRRLCPPRRRSAGAARTVLRAHNGARRAGRVSVRLATRCGRARR